MNYFALQPQLIFAQAWSSLKFCLRENFVVIGMILVTPISVTFSIIFSMFFGLTSPKQIQISLISFFPNKFLKV